MERPKMSILTKISTLLALLAIAGCAAPKLIVETHSHDHAPHAGIVVPFSTADAEAGFAELKLHDDKGDVELWLTRNLAGTEPFDLPLDSTITISFPNMDQKEIALYIRNREKNEDEENNGNIRHHKTNYFIFPGKTGSDATFLIGKDFITEAVIFFEVNGILYKTDVFELHPHTH
jgi:hypothetical protein